MKIHGFPHHLHEVKAILSIAAKEVLDVQHSDDMVEIVVTYRVFLVYVLLYDFPHLGLCHSLVKPDYILTGRHNRIHAEIAEREHSLHYILFHSGDFTVLCPFLNERDDFILRNIIVIFLDTQHFGNTGRTL